MLNFGLDNKFLILGPKGAPIASFPDGFIDISQDIFSIQTQKNLAITTAGTFTISLIDALRFGPAWAIGVPGVSYAINIVPNDLILIRLNGGDPGDNFHNVMLGVVTRIHKSTRVSGDRVSHYVTVEGQDVTRWLLVHRIFFWLLAIGKGDEVSEGIKELKRVTGFTKEEYLKHFLVSNTEIPADEVIEKLLIGRTDPDRPEEAEPGFISAEFPRIGEVFRYIPLETKSKEAEEAKLTKNFPGGTLIGFGEKFVPYDTLGSYYGNAANLLTSYGFDPFCELWGDVDEAGPVFNVFFRRCPFDRADWEDLTTHTVPDGEITGVDLGRAEAELVNFISVLPRLMTTSETDLIRLFLPKTFKMDWASILSRGLRPMMKTTKYLDQLFTDKDGIKAAATPPNTLIGGAGTTIPTVKPQNKRTPKTHSNQVAQQFKNGKGPLFDKSDLWSDVLWRWYSILSRLWAGRITFKGRPNIKVGERIRVPGLTRKHFDQTMVFYVVGIGHDYNVHDGRYITTVRVTRGQGEDAFVTVETDGKEDMKEGNAAKARGNLKNNSPVQSQTLQLVKGRIGNIVFGGP